LLSFFLGTVFAQVSKDDCQMFDSVGREEYAQRVIKNIAPEFFQEKDLKTSLGFLQ
jgi:hypothetical protein